MRTTGIGIIRRRLEMDKYRRVIQYVDQAFTHYEKGLEKLRKEAVDRLKQQMATEESLDTVSHLRSNRPTRKSGRKVRAAR